MKKNHLTLIIIIILGVVLASSYYLYNYYTTKPSIVKNNAETTSKTYIDDLNGFIFEYSNSYEFEETIQEGNTLIYLKKDEKLDDQGYALLKGTNVMLVYKKNVPLSSTYVEEDNKFAIEDLKDTRIEEKTINGIETVEFIYGNSYPLKFSGINKIYFKNKNDILELSLMLGLNVTQSEYEKYLKDFDSIVKSVRFTK